MSWIVTILYIFVRQVPKGREEASDKDNAWSVAVTVNDENGHPIANALVVCTVLIAGGSNWLDWKTPRITGKSCHADSWEFTEDRRLKSVFCGAEKSTYNIDGLPDYPRNTNLLLAPRKGENDLEITLTTSPPPS